MNFLEISERVTRLTANIAEFIGYEAKHFDKNRREYKGKNDLVSYVDKTSEKRIVEGLANILPEAGFLGEEGTNKNIEAEFLWVIDPLDGTTNFIHGIPTYSISIALMHKKIPVVGVVHEVNLNECFYAIKGQGAFLNGEKIQGSEEKRLQNSLLATGFPYHEFEDIHDYIDILKEFMKNCHGVRRIGSAAVDLAYVSIGRFEGFFEFNLKPWDVAAGTLLVTEAGGTVSDFSGSANHIFGGEIVAANGIHSFMLETIAKYWKDY